MHTITGQITNNGRRLALSLLPHLDAEPWYQVTHLQTVCSRICRAAAANQTYSEILCNREMTKAEHKRWDNCEQLIRRLVSLLPLCEGKQMIAYVNSEPRGCSSIIMPNGAYDTMGGRERGLAI